MWTKIIGIITQENRQNWITNTDKVQREKLNSHTNSYIHVAVHSKMYINKRLRTCHAVFRACFIANKACLHFPAASSLGLVTSVLIFSVHFTQPYMCGKAE